MPAMNAPRPDILWAEDAEGDRRLITQALEDAPRPPAVHFVPDGPQLLEALQGRRPSLVVLDLNLPGMHGTEVLQRLRDREATRRLPIIVFTASSDPDEYAACGRLGADAVVHKPVSLDGFLQAVVRISDKAGKIAPR